MAFGLLAAIVAVDQPSEWWGRRHAPRATIEPGSRTGHALVLDAGFLSLDDVPAATSRQ
jgi:hypothetical protein